MTDNDHVPVSVRMGEVVPPEDPEDWTRPLTWVAALGMLAAPLITVVWYLISPPAAVGSALPATYLVAGSLGAGAAATGATQLGTARAWTATLAAGLFGALAVIVLGVAMAGERQVGVASPTLAHAFAASVAGLAGASAASVVAAFIARARSRLMRFLPAALAAVIGATLATGLLMNATP